MKLDDYKHYLMTAFPKAVRSAVGQPGDSHGLDTILKRAAFAHHEEWGFRCVADCFSECVPRSDRLQLEKWSSSELAVDHWRMSVTCRAFSMGANYTHIEIRNTGDAPLPFTETGYRSFFVQLDAFQGGKTPEDFVRAQFPDDEQLHLF